jgi:ubiquitin-protein ligase
MDDPEWRTSSVTIRCRIIGEQSEFNLTVNGCDAPEYIFEEVFLERNRHDIVEWALNSEANKLPLEGYLPFRRPRVPDPRDLYLFFPASQMVKQKCRLSMSPELAEPVRKVMMVAPQMLVLLFLDGLRDATGARGIAFAAATVNGTPVELNMVLSVYLDFQNLPLILEVVGQSSLASDAVPVPAPAAGLGPAQFQLSVLTYAGLVNLAADVGQGTLADNFGPYVADTLRKHPYFAGTHHRAWQSLYFDANGQALPSDAVVARLREPPAFLLGYAGPMSLPATVFAEDSLNLVSVPRSRFPDPEGCFEAYLVLLRRLRGRGRLGDRLRAVIPFAPFHAAFARLSSGMLFTGTDAIVIRETFRSCIAQWASEDLGRALTRLGCLLSNLVRLAEPAASVTALFAPSWGPFDPVPLEIALIRPTVSVVEHEGHYWLTLGQSRLFDPVGLVDSAAPALTRKAAADVAFPLCTKQLTVVLVDVSGTMATVVPQLGIRKLHAAQQCFDRFWDTALHFRTDAVFGAGFFPSNNDAATVLFSAAPFALQPRFRARGRGSIWSALNATLREIREIRDIKRLKKKRILLITDGEVQINEARFDIANKLVRDAVFLDAIIFETAHRGTTDPVELEARGSIVPLCHLTGGRAYLPNSIDEALSLCQREEFVDLSFRRKALLRRAPLTPEQMQLYFLPPQLEFNGQYPEYPLFGQPQKVFLELGTPGSSFREARIAEEFTVAREAGFHVYGTARKRGEAESDIWQAFVNGPPVDGEPVLWNLLVTFPGDYPYAPPVFRFLVIPPLIDVATNGRVFLREFNRYVPGVRVAELLKAIERLPVDRTARPKEVNREKWLKRLSNQAQKVKPFPIKKIADAYVQPWGLDTPAPVGVKAIIACDEDFLMYEK